jgi:hypothetical protein
LPVDDLPDWLPAWCLDHLAGEPVGVLFQRRQVSMVFGLRLAERGFPCARPLTPVAGVGSLAVHAEEIRPGGEVLHGDSPDIAIRNAEVFARLMAELAGVTVAPPLANPPWVRWDHAMAAYNAREEALNGDDPVVRRCAPGPVSRTPPPG